MNLVNVQYANCTKLLCDLWMSKTLNSKHGVYRSELLAPPLRFRRSFWYAGTAQSEGTAPRIVFIRSLC